MFRTNRKPEPLRELRKRRLHEQAATLEQDHREARLTDCRELERALRLGVTLDVEPLVGHQVSGEEVTNSV